jgi:transcriptional regulator with XRE-family HTH domain
MNIKDRAKLVRGELKFTQEKLAEVLAYSYRKIANLEAGKLKKFPADLAILIENKYGYSRKWLEEGIEPKKIALTIQEEKQLIKSEKIIDKLLTGITEQELDLIAECLIDINRKPILMMFLNILKNDSEKAKKLLL